MACLAEGPQAVGQLAAGLPVSRSAVSQHLKILKDAGLVEDTAAGTRRIYRLNPAALAALRDQLDTYWQRALADGTRLAIVARLAEGPRPVGELAAGLPVSRSAVSQHLKILKDAGLVEDTAVGTRRIYRLNPIALAALRDQLDTYWRRALAGYAEAAEAPTGEA